MENVEHCEGKQKKVRLEYNLDSLLKMEWGGEILPLVDFLNLGSNSDELEQAFQKSKILKGEEGVSSGDFGTLSKGMARALESLYSMRTWADAQDVEEFLNERLRIMTNKFKVIDLESRKTKVGLEADGSIQNLWADFMCIFLYRDNWWELLGKCPQCGKWFKRTRKDHVYCSETCRGKASYARNREKRRSERRERYRKNQRI
ncbi:hypothetical protein ACFL6S_18005 [Candidatus Poribacteria bacterium]